MIDLRALTQQYVSAFNAKSIDGIAALLSEDFYLTDPSVKRLGPREKVIDYVHNLFKANSLLSFEAKMILVDGETSVIHFVLTLDNIVYDGIDLISWSQGKMIALIAYLSLRS